jgi:uncharacterized protein (DUF305 family)
VTIFGGFRPDWRRTALLAVVLVAGLTGCSSDPAPRTAGTPQAAQTPQVPVIVPGTPGGPNQTVTALPRATETAVDPDDVTFLADMMIHHTQAVQMAERARTTAVNAKVKALAERIRVGQKPEIDAMRRLLTERGQTPPNLDHVQHENHSAMPGMAGPAQLAELQQATGKAFDTLFLNLMIKHHEGAVTMSGRQIENGSDIRVGEMAQEVSVTQTKEIATMRQLLEEV